MVERLDFLPWEYAAAATPADRAAQAERHRQLAAEGVAELAGDAFVASTAAVFCDRLRMGQRSYIAAHAYVTGEIELGDDTTVNPYAVVRGRITLGDGVRIGAHSSLLAFNHGTEPDRPIFTQPHTARGITVGDDVWIGSNAIVLDGVTIGAHSIIGAGAVVTRDVPEWTVAAGNPAKPLRSRRPVAPSTAAPGAASSVQVPATPESLAAFAARAREQADDVLARCYDGERFVDRPGLGLEPAIRPWCDAIEIADLLLQRTPDGHTSEDLIRRLQSRQDPGTGLVAAGDLASEDRPDPTELSVLEGPASYHVLCAGYALQLLGAGFAHPVRTTTFTSADLGRLPWARNAWSAGAAIDALGTAFARNLLDHKENPGDSFLTLTGWLTARADPGTGLWGQRHPDDGWLQVVNGFYRLTRGTYAQFGLPLPYPEQTVKSVLLHAQDRRAFTGSGYNACNVLDVIHPLWLAGKQTEYGRAEGRRWAQDQLAEILTRWTDGAGFAFAPDAADDQSVPGLQGTEMWLAVIWLLADYLGTAAPLGYRPRGVHRPDPLVPLPGDHLLA
ncbi:putative acetyltransferase protein [Kribbella flavida DSM 17836]|uniref:Putative acetyltransferase protein n=1 Tax=Kribbella flavida (strain DSM 17836 / JCM 10339 / NBRC 14399) TaxID=479435 RepID=D2PRI9_KRIFD|nr:acyltransferase [Kribbella flavida]ADB34907.1 putative acetyltransferase protein [Kribbella flavida DSM 17836]